MIVLNYHTSYQQGLFSFDIQTARSGLLQHHFISHRLKGVCIIKKLVLSVRSVRYSFSNEGYILKESNASVHNNVMVVDLLS